MTDPERAPETTVLLSRAQAGDARALNELCVRLVPRLRRWASGRLPPGARSLTDTEDVVQDAVVQSIKRLVEFEPQRAGAFFAYLRQAVMNRIRDQIRIRNVGERVFDALDEPLSPFHSPLAEVVGRETLERYEAALARLSDSDQEAIVARVEMNCEYDEIAATLGAASAHAARMKVSSALVKLAKEMRMTDSARGVGGIGDPGDGSYDRIAEGISDGRSVEPDSLELPAGGVEPDVVANLIALSKIRQFHRLPDPSAVRGEGAATSHERAVDERTDIGPQGARSANRRLLLGVVAAAVAVMAVGGWFAMRAFDTLSPPLVHDARLLRGESRFDPLHTGDTIAVGDLVHLEMDLARDCSVYVLNRDEAGSAALLFPLPGYELQNPIEADRNVAIPGRRSGETQRAAWTIGTAGGREHFLVVASATALEGFARATPAERVFELAHELARASPETVWAREFVLEPSGGR